MTSNEYIICGACEDLRDHEPYFAKEHLKNYPDYKKVYHFANRNFFINEEKKVR